MEAMTGNNIVRLVGTAAGRPRPSHSCRGEDYELLTLTVRRLSGAEDELPVLLRRRLLAALELREADKLCVTGELRSFNNRSGEGARLVLSVFARSLGFCGDEDENLVRLRGVLCRPPVLRRTPLGRDVCDLMLAVRRSYGRTDYLPCICWGAQALAFSLCPTGTALQLTGRFQSRRYLKHVGDETLTRTAYEVSAAEIEKTGL